MQKTQQSHTQTKLHHLTRPFELENGQILEQAVVAWEEYGQPTGPVVFIAHGGLSNQHAAGQADDEAGTPGWWSGLIGPGKAFDTNRFRVIATNSLGSMFGTTGPQSLNPETRESFGPAFPSLTLRDTVRFQKAFLQELGIERLACMAGPSMGSLQTLTMAALYPRFVGSLVAVATAGRTPPMALVAHHFLMNVLRTDPEFQGGWYGARKPQRALSTIHQFSRIFYGHEEALRQMTWNSVAESSVAQNARSESIRRFLTDNVEARTRHWDPNSIITTLTAINTHDLACGADSFADGVGRITCPALLMNIDTDHEFPPMWAAEIGNLMNARNPGQATVRVIESAWGHLGCLTEGEQLDHAIRDFFVENRAIVNHPMIAQM